VREATSLLTQALGVLDDPMAASVLLDEQVGTARGAGPFDVLLDY
jgi:hypothetical protein